mgnify:CR=1 FL=1
MPIYYGKIKALSPITHGAVDIDIENKTNKSEIRRLPFIVEGEEETKTVYVPIISGNSIKGTTRRNLAQEIREVLGPEEFDKLDDKVKYLIAAGGASTNAKPVVVGQAVYTELRRKLPFISLLGGVYMGHYLKGLLRVGFMVPVVKETVPLFSHALGCVGLDENPDRYPELADLHSNEYMGYTRFKTELADAGDDEEDVESQQQMIYFTKLIPPGTTLFHSFTLSPSASSLEESCFYAFLKIFAKAGAVGGSIAKGHGQIKCNYYTENGELIDLACMEEKEKEFWNYIKGNKEEILYELMNLDKKLQWTGGDDKSQKQ